MIIGFPKEYSKSELRVAISPASVSIYKDFGFTVLVESNAGVGAFFYNDQYKDQGAEIISDVRELYSKADIVVSINQISDDSINDIKDGAIVISLIDIWKSQNFISRLIDKKITAVSMSKIPRTTLAQKMDVLSSQSNISGYRAVLIGSCHLKKYMPLLMTAAGTIKPAKVLILGAGVAGLSAVATAKRLGAQVEVFDVRAEVKEQVESLGAKFIDVVSDTNSISTEDGYAKETSESYKKSQSKIISDHISKSDLVITTALIPEKRAPILISTDMVNRMKPGSVIMDLASVSGGNCELTSKNEVNTFNGVIIDGTVNIQGLQSIDASELYSKNVSSLVIHIFDKGTLNLLMDDEIASSVVYIYKGQLRDDQAKSFFEVKQ